MSKDSFASGELIGFIRFVFDPTQSRSLNATQAYDDSSSQIVLASYPATSTIKTPAKSLGADSGKGSSGTVAVSGTTYGNVLRIMSVKDELKQLVDIFSPKAISVAYGDSLVVFRSNDSKQNNSKHVSLIGTVSFNGNTADFRVAKPESSKRKSSDTKDIFYGAIIVGTGPYSEWQGKYAVLKVDLVTNNAILRVYNS